MTKKPNTQKHPSSGVVLFTDLAPDRDYVARRTAFKISTTLAGAIDIVIQRKRFLSQERYSEDPVSALDARCLRMLLDAALEMPFITKDPLLLELVPKLEDRVWKTLTNSLIAVDVTDVQIELVRFRGRNGTSFEVDVKVFLVDHTEYVTINAVSKTLSTFLDPQSGCVHDVGFGNMGITFWQTFELPLREWAF